MNAPTETLDTRTTRLVSQEVLVCLTSVVERLFHHEPELAEETENDSVRICTYCGEHIPFDAENGEDDRDDDEWVCGCTAQLDLDLVDREPCEVFEWWSVSTWLASELASRGEVVHRDFYGLEVWGRCATGQAISADHVIETITTDLHNR